MSPLRILEGVLFVGLTLLGAGSVLSQDYPNKPIHIVTAAVGGGSDFTARQIAQGISGPLGQPVVVENRGSGIIQGEYLLKAPPDGYGLVVTGGAFWIGPLLQKIPYDVVADFAPVALLVREVSIVAVHPSLPVKSVKELIALAKARPGELNYGSNIAGGPAHLASELLKSMAGVNIVNVPYKGGAAQLQGLLGGEVQLSISDVGVVSPHMKSGRLKALAVTSAEPTILAPSLPTVAASGLPGYEATSMTTIFAPGKTPAAIVNRLNQEIVRFLNRAETKERFLNSGAEVVASSPEQFGATVKADIAKWAKVIKDAAIKID